VILSASHLPRIEAAPRFGTAYKNRRFAFTELRPHLPGNPAAFNWTISRVTGHLVFGDFHLSGLGVYQDLTRYFRVADHTSK
jgi:hypothetical protein